jgi:biopolymer transport protein ExbD
MSQGSDQEDVIVGINVTPLVDVCLVLVIIFMVTAPILSDPMFKVILPKAVIREGEEKEKIVVSVSTEGRIAIEAVEVRGLDEFSRELKNRLALSPDSYIVFKADQDSRHGFLVDLMLRAKDAGAKSLTIATDKKKDNG